MTTPRQIIYPLYRFIKGCLNYPAFIRDFINFKRLSAGSAKRFEIKWKNRYPCLFDKTESTPFDRHYILHVAWAARKIAKINPRKHVDISSTIDFCTNLSAFIPTEFYDYRPLKIDLPNLKTGSANLTGLPFEDGSIESLSCMHTIEHVGLCRYGDPIDPDGDIKSIRELQRVLKKGGDLLFVVPIGKPKIMFNAHRIYSYDQIMDYFKELKLEEFALIPEKNGTGDLIINASKKQADKEDYGCGCFWFKKN